MHLVNIFPIIIKQYPDKMRFLENIAFYVQKKYFFGNQYYSFNLLGTPDWPETDVDSWPAEAVEPVSTPDVETGEEPAAASVEPYN